MALKVVSFATYLTTGNFPWRDEDYSASKFIKAVKGKHVNGYGHVPVAGQLIMLNQVNADDSIEWFGRMAADYLKAVKLTASAILVPIPNSTCTVDNDVVPRTARLAQAIASKLKGVLVVDCLRWKEEMTPSSQGGTRNPQILYDSLVVTKKITKAKIVLVDDVRTKGSHLMAAKARVQTSGATCLMAVCAGRTVLAPEAEPFSTLEEDLADFVPH
jgi:hypothetical protein